MHSYQLVYTAANVFFENVKMCIIGLTTIAL